MNRYTLLIALAIGLAAAAPARFDVVSIKPSAPASTAQRPRSASATDPCPFRVTAGRLTVECVPMRRLISYAFRIPANRVTGPDWLSDGQKFDIAATFPAAQATQVPEMLQAMLKERFGLAIHEGTVDQEVAALVVDKGGLKIRQAPPALATDSPTTDPSGVMTHLGGLETVQTEILNDNGTKTFVRTNPRIGTARQTENANYRFHIEAPNTTLEGLLDLLSPVGLQMDMIDMTGLEGRYSLDLDFSLKDAFAVAASIPIGGDPAASRDLRADMQNAILKGIDDGLAKLGLRLEHRKAPVKTIVVDHLERMPTAN